MHKPLKRWRGSAGAGMRRDPEGKGETWATSNYRGRDVQQYELRVQRLDVRFDEKLKLLYEAAMNEKKWRGTPAVHSRVEYWAEGVLAYFNAHGQGGVPNDAPHPIASREQLQEYDPGLFALVNETFAYDGHVDWRYHP